MDANEFLRRVDDLADRAERRGIVTRTGFLTPAEQYMLRQYYKDDNLVLTGGQSDCERQAAFFLPDFLDPEQFDPAEFLCAVKIEAHFGSPGHRDYLGAVLGLGIVREAVGDIRIFGETAYLFCLPTVETVLIEELKKVGHISVTAAHYILEDVPAAAIKVRKISFTVKSLRLDAVAGPMFGMSRTAAADLIRMGAASLNYALCERTDAPVKEGDIISLRGHGKGCLKTVGGRSRKDRLFVEAEVYL